MFLIFLVSLFGPFFWGLGELARLNALSRSRLLLFIAVSVPFAALMLAALHYLPLQALLQTCPAFAPYAPFSFAVAVFLLPIPSFSLTLHGIKRLLGIPTSAREDLFYGLLFPPSLIAYGVVFFFLYVVVRRDFPVIFCPL